MFCTITSGELCFKRNRFLGVFRTLTHKLMVCNYYPAGNYLLKVYSKTTRTRCEKYVCKVNSKDISWTYFTPCSCVSIVNFEEVNAGWVIIIAKKHSCFAGFWKCYWYRTKNFSKIFTLVWSFEIVVFVGNYSWLVFPTLIFIPICIKMYIFMKLICRWQVKCFTQYLNLDQDIQEWTK